MGWFGSYDIIKSFFSLTTQSGTRLISEILAVFGKKYLWRIKVNIDECKSVYGDEKFGIGIIQLLNGDDRSYKSYKYSHVMLIEMVQLGNKKCVWI